MQSTRKRQPSIEALRTLLTFAEAGGVTAAAERLGVKQPVVSHKLGVFQDAERCGAVLIKHDQNGTELTEAGVAVLPAIRELVQRYDQLFESLKGNRSAPERVRNGLGQFAARFYVPPALRELETCSRSVRSEPDTPRPAMDSGRGRLLRRL